MASSNKAVYHQRSPTIPSQLTILLLGCPDQTGQRAAQPGWQLFPLPPSLPSLHPSIPCSILSTLPLLCAQPRDLICLVISGLACSAQLHSKVKLDKGIGASPCKTASPWQLLEWAADCRREWRRREERGGEGGEGGGWRMYLRGRQTPIHFSLFQRGVLCQEGSQLRRRKLFKVETKHQVLPGTNLVHNTVLELIQSVQQASTETLARQRVLKCVMDHVEICHIYFVNADHRTPCLTAEITAMWERFLQPSEKPHDHLLFFLVLTRHNRYLLWHHFLWIVVNSKSVMSILMPNHKITTKIITTKEFFGGW